MAGGQSRAWETHPQRRHQIGSHSGLGRLFSVKLVWSMNSFGCHGGGGMADAANAIITDLDRARCDICHSLVYR